MRDHKKISTRMTLMVLLFISCLLLSFMLGRYPIDPVTLVKVLLSKIFPIPADWSTQIETVLFQVRLPRVVMAAVIGAGLSCAGSAYQGIFQNPMVSPDILGASSGAGFGAALGLFFSWGYQVVTFNAFLFGLGAVAVTCLVASRVKYHATLGLVLAGMMMTSLFTAAVSYLKLVADPNNTLPVITYWLMGSLASIRPSDVTFALPWIAVGTVPILLMRWKINVMTLGDEEAKCIGINATRVRIIIVLCSTLISAAAVSVSGMIGWVGLVIPHFARMLVGSDFRKLLPAAMLLGGSFLLTVDNFARLLASSEIPIGILTAFVGAPFFLYLIMREGSRL